ncbi:MAG: cell wall metabolism sensor histidine kinase WalK [Lachnospiraceae bacterium]|nr:cell wall metabolism sensor histidine kinase WalK [Lachnospiraceae bacterium]
MKRTIYIKFILAYLAFGLLSFLLIAIISSKMTLNDLIRDNANTLFREANLISTKYAESFYSESLSTQEVSDQLEAIDTFTSSIIWIINKDGEILYNSRGLDQETEPTLIEEFDPTDTGNRNYMTGSFYGQFDEEMLSVFSPINSGFKIMGYVVIHTPMSDIIKRRDDVLSIFYISLAIMFALSLIILFVFTFTVFIPIKRISRVTKEYAAGNLDYKLELNSRDEIGELSDSLNYMAARLKRTEDDQKKFIANVSHDFRSPLTSIRGYLEAMVDGTIPEDLHEKYIKIVLNETDRLTKLTGSLLMLNNLSTKGMMLEKSDFDINKVIKRTAETFEGICKKKKIRFKLVLTGTDMFVNADLGKIQQVLYNLIDNAIKFSDQNSTIKVETTEKNETVFVSVKDNGIGIPKDDIKHIFDRFYKSDSSRGKDKKGTGLGLSIVKEIINAHEENINVISTEGAGSEFIFTLPKAKNIED